MEPPVSPRAPDLRNKSGDDVGWRGGERGDLGKTCAVDILTRTRSLVVQWGLLLVAVQALTRVPVRAPFHPDALRQGTRYFPLVGLGVGILAAVVFVAARTGLPPLVAAALSLAATLLLTGAMHEDGLADTADGLFGGRTRDDALRIMRDSRLGTFGVLALLVVLATKLAATASLGDPAPALVAAHAASRFWAVLPPSLLPYARPDGMAAGIAGPSRTALVVAALFGLVPLLLLPGFQASMALLLSGLAALGVGAWSRQRIGGYTGDVLGATAVLTEVAVLLVAAWRPA